MCVSGGAAGYNCAVRRLAPILLAACHAAAATVPTESDGLLVVEAENFDRQRLSEVREWTVVTSGLHADSASGKAYAEVLPDTRVTHADPLVRDENFSNEPGAMAVLEYDVSITNPGRYFVWVRAYSTGTEDNGIHVGLDGAWPDSGRRMQWCEGKHAWTWASKQRTSEQHCGVPGLIWLDIDTPGRHTIMFSMREDGFEMDAWALATNPDFVPGSR